MDSLRGLGDLGAGEVNRSVSLWDLSALTDVLRVILGRGSSL